MQYFACFDAAKVFVCMGRACVLSAVSRSNGSVNEEKLGFENWMRSYYR